VTACQAGAIRTDDCPAGARDIPEYVQAACEYETAAGPILVEPSIFSEISA
jgi:hypothetical protein